MNRSIEKLSCYSDLHFGEMLLYLIPFFMNNQAFESLNITHLNTTTVNGGHLDTLEYTLEQFNELKELTLICNVTPSKGEDKVIEALFGHVGLRKK